MHITNRSITSMRIAETIFMGLLAAVLVGFAAGCGLLGGDDDGGDGSDNGDDGDGDGGGVTAPAAPSGLTTSATDGAVGLEWSAVDDADAYRVYRATSPTDGISGSALNTGISQANYTDGTAENGTTYYYRVTAVNSQDGETAESDGSGEAQGTPFTAPTELSGTSGDSQVVLDWSEAAGAESYNVYRSTSPFDEVSGVDPLASGVAPVGYTDQSAENGTTYYYRVTSVNPEGEESGVSAEEKRTPFTNPTELSGTSGDSQIELDWSAAAGAETYNVYRSTSSTDGASGDPLATGVSQASYTDQSAANGTKYYYRVTSVNPETEESSASNEVAKTPFEDPNRP